MSVAVKSLKLLCCIYPVLSVGRQHAAPVQHTSLQQSNSRRLTFSWLWLVSLMLLTFALGARGLYAAPLWGDERNTILDTFGSWRVEPMPTPAQIWSEVAERNPWHAPGYFILLNLWGRFAGYSELTLRAFSLFAGMLALAWTYRLGCDWFSPRIGLYAAAVLGTSGLFIHYLYHLRVYALFVLLTPLLFWLYFRLIKSEKLRSPVLWIGFTTVTAILLYIHYFAALSLAVIGVYHLLFVPKNRRWWKIFGVMMLAGVLFLPWATVLQTGIGRAVEDEDRQSVALNTTEAVNELIYVFSNGVPIFLGVLLVLSLVGGDRKVWRVWFFTLTLLAALLMINTQLKVIVLAGMRYLLGLWPLLALLVALGLSRLGMLSPAVTAVWMIVGVVNNSTFPFESLLNASANVYKFPWHTVTQPFRQVAQPGDVLVLSMPDDYGSIASATQNMTSFYLDGSLVSSTVVESLTPGLPVENRYDAAQRLIEEQNPLRVWVGYGNQLEASDLDTLHTNLDRSYNMCPMGLPLESVNFDLYARSQVCCLPDESVEALAQFGEGIYLVQMDSLPETATDNLPVILSWAVSENVPSNTYSVALHVLQPGQDAPVAQADYPLPVQIYGCQETVISLADAALGDYELYVIVYAWERGQRLVGEMANGTQGERLLLGRFKVE